MNRKGITERRNRPQDWERRSPGAPGAGAPEPGSAGLQDGARERRECPGSPREPGAPGGPPLLFSRPGPEQLREAPEQPREPGADASSSPIRLFIKIPLNPPPTPGPPDTHSIRHPPSSPLST